MAYLSHNTLGAPQASAVAHTGYRLEVDKAFGCRPKRGEARHKDGRLLKCSIYFGRTLAECLQDARAAAEAGARIAPGYAEIVAVRSYARASYELDPLRAVPQYRAETL